MSPVIVCPLRASVCRYLRALLTTAWLAARWSERKEDRTVATRSHDPTIIATATRAVAATVMRRRTVPHELPLRRLGIVRDLGRGVRDQAVARPAHGQDGLHAERRVDLLAHVADVDLDDVRVALEVGAPDLVEQDRLRDDRVGAPHQQL